MRAVCGFPLRQTIRCVCATPERESDLWRKRRRVASSRSQLPAEQRSFGVRARA